MYTKILMAGWEAPYVFEYGGLSTFNKYLIKALLDMGHEVLWVGLHPDPRMRGVMRTDIEGYTVYIVDTPGTLDTREDLPRVWAELSRVEPLLGDTDLVLIHDFHLAPLAMYASRHRVGVRTYLHVASMEPVEAMALLYSEHVYTNSRLMLDRVVGPYVENIYRAMMRDAVPVDVVYPAPPTYAKEELVRAEIWRDWAAKQYPDTSVKALVFGRMQENKMTPHLYDAVEVLRRKGLDIGLLVAGRGWPEYRRGWLHMMGEQPEEKKMALMMEADIFVLPSTWEPFGMVVLEAMELGVQHIALTTYSGVKEVVEAPVFNPEKTESIVEAIEKALEEKANYKDEYREWNWRKTAEKLTK